jgi:hypothetical protein
VAQTLMIGSNRPAIAIVPIMSDTSTKEIKYRRDLFNSRRIKEIVGVNLLSVLNI